MRFMKKEEKIHYLNEIVSLLPEFICLDVRRYIACQFALESDFGSSAFAKCNNNHCGMKVPSLRLTLAVNFLEKGEFAVFSGIVSCVHDYLLWLQFNRFSRTELYDLFAFVKHLENSGYCPDLGYYDKIHSIYSQYYE